MVVGEMITLDDYPMAKVPTEPMWSENYAFMINDAACGVSFASVLGRWPVKSDLWRELFVVALPGERMLYHKAWGRAASATVASASMFHVEVVEPHKTFRLLFDGHVQEDSRANLLECGAQPRPVRSLTIDIVLEGVASVWDMSGHSGAAEAISGKAHTEQVLKANGEIVYGGETFALNDAFCIRDHTRGVRVVTNVKRHCWAQAWFPEQDLTFHAYYFEVHGSDTPMTNASIAKGGERFPATVKSLVLRESHDDHKRLYAIVMESALGKMTFTMRRVVQSTPLSLLSPADIHVGAVPGEHAASFDEEAVIWELNGEEGAGWSERIFNSSPFPE